MSGPYEFSRPIAVARLGPHPTPHRIEADPEERAALARRFGVPSIARLVATVTLGRRSEGSVRLDAALEAELVQSCIVTMDPVPARVAEDFTLIYRPDIDEETADRLALEHPEDDPVEPLEGDAIDIGEAVAQQLSLAMDPYPRAPGVELGEADPDEPILQNPFSALAALRPKS